MKTKRLQELDRAPSAKAIGRHRLPEKILVCNKEGRDGSGKANIIDSPGDTVWGVLFEIQRTELGNLDRIEVCYKRVVLDVITDRDSPVEAYVYISSELTDDPRPYDWYKRLMIEGAREHGLPDLYVKYLEELPSKSTS